MRLLIHIPGIIPACAIGELERIKPFLKKVSDGKPVTVPVSGSLEEIRKMHYFKENQS
ncbi:MAG: hypothetical protein ACP5JA_07290 [Thermodesulfovibrio sp.]